MLALARKRQSDRLVGHGCIADYHNGAYECDFVSPWTKSATRPDADLMIIAQDWTSDVYLSEAFRPFLVDLGYDPTLATNRNLHDLLYRHFKLNFEHTYATNLFPFVKQGSMSANIPSRDLTYCAKTYLLPQMDIVRPKLAVCLGLGTFNAIRRALGLRPVPDIYTATLEPIRRTATIICGVAHTGALGMNARGRSRVEADWASLRRYLH